MVSENLDCAVCGLHIGVGIPGSNVFCRRCGEMVIGRASAGDTGGIMKDLLGLAVGVGIGLVALGILTSIFGGNQSRRNRH